MKKYYLVTFLYLTAWIFTLAQVPGSVVAYSPAASGLYIGSPSICILPNGDYLASHDLFGPNSKEFERPNSRIYRSQDKGKTWTQIAEINGQFWSKLFVHEKGLYFMGTSKHHGNTIIRKSFDDGRTWTEPTDGENGLLLAGEYHCAPMPLIEHNGRLWRAMEDAMGPIKKWGKRYGAFMMSIPLGADPMKAANWTSSNVLRYDSTLLNGNFGGWIEGNAVVDPNGQLWDVLRVDDKSTLEEKAAFVRISADGKTATFDRTADFVRFPGGGKKFSIRYDSKSKLYWTIANTTNVRFAQLIDGIDNQSPHIGAPVGNALGPSDLDILSVEIIPGTASALYGMNAINGLANFQTKSPFEHLGLSFQQKSGLNHLNDNNVTAKLFNESTVGRLKSTERLRRAMIGRPPTAPIFCPISMLLLG